MGMNMVVFQIVNEFKRLDEVTAITIAGSYGSGRADAQSDIDIDIITSKEIPVEKRKGIIKKLSDEMEINNNFWGTGDEFIMRNSSIYIDIAYFDMNWLKERLDYVVDKFNASTGYTTCFWYNVEEAQIVYDKDGEFKKLQEKYKVPYPKELKENIINKNYNILRKNFSSYYFQIKKAISRNDLVNINNRISAFLDSYFDIIFAINEFLHPGEKRLINIAETKCSKLPKRFSKSINELVKSISSYDEDILKNINIIVDNLDELLKEEKLN